MTTILLTRHGQTEWNREERYRGRADLPLNATGERQAAALAERLATFPVAAVYTSPLRRALRTAEVCAARLGLSAQVLPGLLDIDFGAWQGLTPQEAAARDPEVYRQWLAAPGTIRFPDGEGLADVQRRAMEALDAVTARHRDETVVLVAHMVVNRVLLCTVLGLDLNHYFDLRQDTCSLNIFRYLGPQRYEIIALNDTCHMAGVG